MYHQLLKRTFFLMTLCGSVMLSAGDDAWSKSGSHYSYTRTGKIAPEFLPDGGIKYTFSLGCPEYPFDAGTGSCTPGDLKYSGNATRGPASGVTGTVEYGKDELPTSDTSMSMSGKLIPPEGAEGSQPTWSASATLQSPFWLEASPSDIVKAGTAVTVTAKGDPTESTWTINSTDWKDHSQSNSEKYKTSSIVFNRDMWDKMKWTPNPIPKNYLFPSGGNYSVSATTTEEQDQRSASISIKVLELVKLQYRIGSSGSFQDFEDYNDDGIPELIIPYYNTITTVEDELKGVSKKEIEIFFRVNLQPDISEWPNDKPTWEGATVSSADRTIASKKFNNKGTTTIKVKYDASYAISADVHIVKVHYTKDGTEYGFDAPYSAHPNDYQTYVSVDKSETTSVKLNLDPKPSNLTFYAQTADKTKFKIGTDEKKEIASGTEVINIAGMNPAGNNTDSTIKIYVQHLTDQAKNYTFPDMISVLLFKKKEIPNWYIYRVKPTSSAPNVATGLTSSNLKNYANNVVKSAVAEFDNVYVSPQLVIPFDINGNGALDWYYDGGSQPEHSIIASSPNITGDPKLVIVSAVNFAWRTTADAAIGDTSVTLQGNYYISSWINRSYTFGVGANAENVTITGVSGNVITFGAPLTKNHPSGETVFASFAGGVSADPQIVLDSSNADRTSLHETLHRGNVGNLLDISDRVENIMLYYIPSAGGDVILRHRSQKLHYSNSRENQWSKFPR